MPAKHPSECTPKFEIQNISHSPELIIITNKQVQVGLHVTIETNYTMNVTIKLKGRIIDPLPAPDIVSQAMVTLHRRLTRRQHSAGRQAAANTAPIFGNSF